MVRQHAHPVNCINFDQLAKVVLTTMDGIIIDDCSGVNDQNLNYGIEVAPCGAICAC